MPRPAATQQQERIRQLASFDAEVLQASSQFPTFSDAFAKTARLALPALEAQALTTMTHDGGAEGKCAANPCNSKDGAVDHGGCDNVVDVFLCLPALAWDITRRHSLSSSAATAVLSALVAPQMDTLRHNSRRPRPEEEVFAMAAAPSKKQRTEALEPEVRHAIAIPLPLSERSSPCRVRNTLPSQKSSDISAASSFFARLAAVCADLSIVMHLVVEQASTSDVAERGGVVFPGGVEPDAVGARGRDGILTTAVTTTAYRLLKKQWHCGKEITSYVPVEGSQGLPPQRLLHGGDVRRSRKQNSFSVRVITKCAVRGLFHNLPVRRAPFCLFLLTTSETRMPCSGVAHSITTSASAVRARQEEQQHLLSVLFQEAACTLLAPLYLHDDALPDAGSNFESGCSDGMDTVGTTCCADFSARLIAENIDCQRVLSTTRYPNETSPGFSFPIVSLRRATGSSTTELYCTSCARTGRYGLRLTREGLYTGALVAKRGVCAKGGGDGGDGRQGHPLVSGKATAQRLCRIFGVAVPPSGFSFAEAPSLQRSGHVWRSPLGERLADVSPSLRERHGGDEKEGEMIWTEVVVRRGRFAVLFAVPSATYASCAAVPRRCDVSKRSIRASAAAAVTSIYVREGPSAALFASCPCHVLESTHWAYDVVAAKHRQRCGSLAAAAYGVPVFIFVERTYVPTYAYAVARHAPEQVQNGPVGGQRGDVAVGRQETFAELFDEALGRLLETSSAADTMLEDPLTEAAIARPAASSNGTGLPQVDTTSHTAVPLSSAAPHVDSEAVADLASVCPEKCPSSPTPSTTERTIAGRITAGTADGQLRMRYVCQRLLEAATPAETQSCTARSTPPVPQGATLSSISLPPDAHARSGRLHRVRLDADTLRRCAEGQVGRPCSAVPRRTPVSLDPKIYRMYQEEKQYATELASDGTCALTVAAGSNASPSKPVIAQLLQRSGNVSERLARMRRLLDTGRGSVLRRIPRACAAPQAWTPNAGGASPIEATSLAPVSVVQWARKFLVLTCPPATRHVAVTRDAYPRMLSYWVLDQHAVHERVRLEFFLTFADSYVRHPELPHPSREHPKQPMPSTVASNSDIEGVASGPSALSPHVHDVLLRRCLASRLLQSLAHQRCTTDGTAFPVLLPADLCQRVTLVEPHLWRWGWRFHHEQWRMIEKRTKEGLQSGYASSRVEPRTPEVSTAADLTFACPDLSATKLTRAVSVVAWPCLEVEGTVRHLTSMQALRCTVEELEAVGAASSVRSAALPSRTAGSSDIIPSIFLDFFISRSCRGAIMFGDTLRPTAAQCMLDALQCVEQYYVCSHGRPSFSRLDLPERMRGGRASEGADGCSAMKS